MIDLWHDVPRGTDIEKEFNVIIEIPKNSQNKYEIDKETGLIALDRANYSAASYPFDYGFIPQTLWEDGDALDVVMLTTFPLLPGIMVKARAVGVMRMHDTGESDWNIMAVPVNDKRWDDVQNIGDINKHSLNEYQHFFEGYKELKKGEKGLVEIKGYGDKAEAITAIELSIKQYDEKYPK